MKNLLIIAFLSSFLLGCQPDRTPQDLRLAGGSVERYEQFPSEFIKPRHVDVWLPEGYNEQQQYEVLYMHDGQMLFDSTTTWNKQEWGVDDVMSQLISQGKVRSTIVVGVWNTEFRHSEYFPQKPFESLPAELQDSLIQQGKRNGATALFKSEIQSDNYLAFLVQELKPFIDREYATYPDRDHTFVAGSSMGGLISMYALCEYPTVFGGAACLSTHWLGTFDTLNNPIPAQFAAYLKNQLPANDQHKIYFDFGTETLDAYYEPYQFMIDAVMLERGYDERNWQTWKFDRADHSERAWKQRLHIPLIFLLGKDH